MSAWSPGMDGEWTSGWPAHPDSTKAASVCYTHLVWVYKEGGFIPREQQLSLPGTMGDNLFPGSPSNNEQQWKTLTLSEPINPPVVGSKGLTHAMDRWISSQESSDSASPNHTHPFHFHTKSQPCNYSAELKSLQQ